MPNWCDNTIEILARREINDEIAKTVNDYLGRRFDDAHTSQSSFSTREWTKLFIDVRTGYGPPSTFINHVLQTYKDVHIKAHYWIEGGCGAADFEMSSDDEGNVHYLSHEEIDQDYYTEDDWNEIFELVTEEEQRFDDCRSNPNYARLLDMGYEIKNEEDYRNASVFKFLNVLEARESLIQYITNTGPYYRSKYIEMTLVWIKTQQAIDPTAKRAYEWFTALNKSLQWCFTFGERETVEKAPEWKTFSSHWRSPTFQSAVNSLLQLQYSQPKNALLEEIDILKEQIQTIEQEGERNLEAARKELFPKKQNESGEEWFKSLGSHWKLNDAHRNLIKENQKSILDLFHTKMNSHTSLKTT